LNIYNKLAVVEHEAIRTACFVDAYPKAEITWFGPSGQRLNSFTREKFINQTVTSSELDCKFSFVFNQSILLFY
jgi:hypothetical protein